MPDDLVAVGHQPLAEQHAEPNRGAGTFSPSEVFDERRVEPGRMGKSSWARPIQEIAQPDKARLVRLRQDRHELLQEQSPVAQAGACQSAKHFG